MYKGLPLLMKEAEGKEDLSDLALQRRRMEANAQIQNAATQVFHMVQPPSVCSGSYNSSSGSAVSALQSKFKEISQRRSKGKETHYALIDGLSEPKEQSSLSIPEVKIFKSSNSVDEVSEVRNLTASSYLKGNKWEKEEDSIVCSDSGLGEGPGMKNCSSGHGGTILSKPTTSQKYWTPSRSFRQVARRESIVANLEVDSLAITIKNVLHAKKEEQTLRVGDIMIHKELIHKELDTLESTFQGCFQKEQSPPDKPGKKDIIRYKTEKVETEKDQTAQTTSAMLAEGQYQPSLINEGLPPSYKEADWDTAIIFGSELHFRSDSTLSPRHEQAKRLLARARLKARSQNQNSDQGAEATQKEVMELLPTHNPPPQIITTTHEQKVPLPVELQDVRGENRKHDAYSWSQSHVHFEDESKKEAECSYRDRVCKRGLVLMDSSISNPQPKSGLPPTVSQGSKSLGSSQGHVGYQLAILTNQGDPSLETVLCKDEPKKCKACGSILTSSHTKESRQSTEGKRRPGNQWVTSGQSSQQIIQPNLLEATLLNGNSSLDETVEAAGASDAGERVSAFGKLRRRSRKGENRVEAGHGPYARGQDLLAQRRNSRTRSSLEEMSGPRSKPARGVTFATDYFIPTAAQSRTYTDSAGIQLPIKSALKSTSKNRLIGQHGVKILPPTQEVERSPHHAVATPPDLGAPSQVSQVYSGLTPCIKPSSLRYSSPVGTPVEPVDAHSPSEDSTCAGSRSPECRPNVRGAGLLKTEDLRAELLRSEHLKAESQWDEYVAASRRTLEREGRPKLSLRRFFSAMGLNSMGKMVKGSRSSSMEQLSLSTARTSPSPTHKGQTQLQRTPSLQALHTESPLAQLRKVSSVQSLQSPKKKYEHSPLLGELHLPLTLGPRDLHVKKGVENLDASQVSGPVGRIIQTFPDGSLLLELTRPVSAPFGFVISRGKGRPDSGIYVEQVGGSTASENIYTSLLGVGDEILEVNEEKVTGLSLDQVTCLMTRESMATIRILPHRWIQH